jgi:hypothetical protein
LPPPESLFARRPGRSITRTRAPTFGSFGTALEVSIAISGSFERRVVASAWPALAAAANSETNVSRNAFRGVGMGRFSPLPATS